MTHCLGTQIGQKGATDLSLQVRSQIFLQIEKAMICAFCLGVFIGELLDGYIVSHMLWLDSLICQAGYCVFSIT